MIIAKVNLLKTLNEQELLKVKAHWQHRLQKVALMISNIIVLLNVTNLKDSIYSPWTQTHSNKPQHLKLHSLYS